MPERTFNPNEKSAGSPVVDCELGWQKGTGFARKVVSQKGER